MRSTGGTLESWVHAARRGNLCELGNNQKPLTDLELARVKRELVEVKLSPGYYWALIDRPDN